MTTDTTQMQSMDDLIRRHELETGARLDEPEREELFLVSAATALPPQSTPAHVEARVAAEDEPTRNVNLRALRRRERRGLIGSIRRDFAESSGVKKASAAVLVGVVLVSLGGLVARQNQGERPQKISAGEGRRAPDNGADEGARAARHGSNEGSAQAPSFGAVLADVQLGGAAAMTLELSGGATSPETPAGSASLERRAVDAVVAGDATLARAHYERLAAEHAEREVFREAARILARSEP